MLLPDWMYTVISRLSIAALAVAFLGIGLGLLVAVRDPSGTRPAGSRL